MQKERKTSLRERKRKEKRWNDILALEREKKSQTGEREREKERKTSWMERNTQKWNNSAGDDLK